jgi:exopolyphosphatase / guanosine-5'-triphosphate,3'-diphosphate pyrophosphatase
MRIGVIDLGSNTIRLVIYIWDGEKLEKIHNIKRYAQSIKFVHQDKMDQDGMDVIVQTVKELMMIARIHETQQLNIFATASLRNIENSHETKEYIEKQIQHPVEILDGLDESLYGFEGIKRSINLPVDGLSIDIGGGSTELTYFRNQLAIQMISIPFGSLNLSLKCVSNVLPSVFEENQIRNIIREQIDRIEWLSDLKINSVIGIGGSVRAIMKLKQAIDNQKDSIYHMQLSAKDVHNISQSFQKDTIGFPKLILQVVPDRLQTVIPGALIIDEIMSTVSAKQLSVSAFGLREGYLFTKVLDKKGSYE